MKSKTCQELLNAETISYAFKDDRQELSEQVLSCFFSCYRWRFIQWAKIAYHHYHPDIIEFEAANAFTDGVLKFTEVARRGELYQSNTSVKTILFHYCRNMLLGHLKKEKRIADKNKDPGNNLPGEKDSSEKVNEYEEKRQINMMLALQEMSVSDRQIIQWRHIDEKSHDEMAKLLAITVASATNQIFRCMQRLRVLVEAMDNAKE